MNEWLTTALPILVVPVSSTATAASCVPFAGRNSTPERACHMAMIGATAGKIDRPIGMSVRVVADWLVVSAARMKIARANDERSGGRHVAEQRDDLIVVERDERVGEPRDAEQREHRDDA